MKILKGVGASSGTGIARAFLHRAGDIDLPEGYVSNTRTETKRLEEALAHVAAELEEKAARTDGEVSEILVAQAAMARDPELIGVASTAIMSTRTPAARAIVDACETFAVALIQSNSEYLSARADDIRFVGSEAARRLLGRESPNVKAENQDVVIIADEVSPADVADLDVELVKGIATEQGSPTSHTAIVARALGVPAVVAVMGLLDAVDDDSTVAVDGDRGEVHVDPEERIRVRYQESAAEQLVKRQRLLERVKEGPTTTRDGHPIQLAANVSSVADLQAALDAGAEGIGLLRTELLYMKRKDPPAREEQLDLLAEMVTLLGDRRLVIRTFDFGADKPVPFLKVDAGPNPALDVRGLRLARMHEDLLDDQLTAIVAVAANHRIAVMAPMVATVDEAEWFITKVEQAGGRDVGLEVGIMVEVPSAVLIADHLAAQLDFLSIGTNDLTQYLHAADRQVGALAHLQDPFSPALLSAVKRICDAAAHRAWVGVCGEAAGQPAWALLAAGLGVTELSMAPGDLLHVKVALHEHDLVDCRAAALEACSSTTAEYAQAIAAELLSG